MTDERETEVERLRRSVQVLEKRLIRANEDAGNAVRGLRAYYDVLDRIRNAINAHGAEYYCSVDTLDKGVERFLAKALK